MEVVFNEQELQRYISEAVKVEPAHPVLIDEYLQNAVEVDVDVTTVPDASNWLAPSAVIIETSATVAPLIKISSAAHATWNKDPKPCPD